MMSNKWSAFKNGSDIRGVASEGISNVPVNLTDDAVSAISKSFILLLESKYNVNPENLTISIGHDSRISAERIKSACIKALTQCGAHVYDFGLCTTPAMFMSTIDDELNIFASIMITASHLPFNRNGLKFFTRDGGLESSDITEILSYAQKGEFTYSASEGKVRTFDYLSRYAGNIAEFIKKETGLDMPFKNMKIAVDAGNGVGGFYAEKILKPLGADIGGSCFLEPEGTFPNHIPNPEDATAMQAISKAVLSSESDLGIIFDTDVDRAAIVDNQGREINKNRLIALISAVLLKEKKGTIVTDSVTSTGLSEFINNDLGGNHHRFRRGYKNVINEAIRLNREGTYCPLAIETSGHAALAENHFLDDGAYLVTKLLIEAVRLRAQGRKLTELIENLKEPAISTGHRLNLTGEDFKKDGEKILDDLKKCIENHNSLSLEQPNFEGVRVNLDGGWFLLRLSLHDPLMPLDIQCDSQECLDKIYGFLKEFLSGYNYIDISTLP